MQFELASITFTGEQTLVATFHNPPSEPGVTGEVAATFQVPLTFSMSDTLTAISDRAMHKLKATLAE